MFLFLFCFVLKIMEIKSDESESESEFILLWHGEDLEHPKQYISRDLKI